MIYITTLSNISQEFDYCKRVRYFPNSICSITYFETYNRITEVTPKSLNFYWHLDGL